MDLIQTRRARIGVVGLGHVGLPPSLACAEQGFQVLGFEERADDATLDSDLDIVITCVPTPIDEKNGPDLSDKVVCDRMGIDVWEVIGAAATKPFGYMPFYPGPGLGGHCIPIAPYAVMILADHSIDTRNVTKGLRSSRAKVFGS